jgi:hypothetical protein
VKARLRTHAFVWDPDMPDDRDGRKYCLCGLREDNKVHDLPPSPGQAAHRQRVGDR